MPRDTGLVTSLTAELAATNDLLIPILPVTQRIYNQFRVRVMPFATVLDSDGYVRSSGLINSESAVQDLLRFGRASVSQPGDKPREESLKG